MVLSQNESKSEQPLGTVRAVGIASRLAEMGFRKLDCLFEPSSRSFYLALFRIYLAFHISKKLFFAWPYLNTLYGKHSFLKWSYSIWGILPVTIIQEHYLLLSVLLLGATVCMGFGLGGRWSILIVYLLQDLFNNTNGYSLDGGDNLLKFALLYLCFCNSFEYFSLSKPRHKSESHRKIDNLFTNLGVASLIMHLMMAYLISGLSKANASVWYNGTAIYYILTNDRFHGTQFNGWLVQNAYFVTFATYGTMLWELFFPFLVWRKSLRFWTLTCGILLHAGIYVFMMIHEFQVLFVMMYGFFFSNAEISSFLHAHKLFERFRKYIGIPEASRVHA